MPLTLSSFLAVSMAVRMSSRPCSLTVLLPMSVERGLSFERSMIEPSSLMTSMLLLPTGVGVLPAVARPTRLMMDSIEMMNTATKIPTTVENTFLINDFIFSVLLFVRGGELPRSIYINNVSLWIVFDGQHLFVNDFSSRSMSLLCQHSFDTLFMWQVTLS